MLLHRALITGRLLAKPLQMLRSLANDLSIPVLMISAQNQNSCDSKRMTSLRESSELEYSADSIMLITTDDDKCVGQDRYARNPHHC